MKPRILLVEDDAVSRAFLAAAAEGLPATIDAVDSCAAARAVQAHGDLWLIDANLPDGKSRLLPDLHKSVQASCTNGTFMLSINQPTFQGSGSHGPMDPLACEDLRGLVNNLGL